jgi:hypothetical protein
MKGSETYTAREEPSFEQTKQQSTYDNVLQHVSITQYSAQYTYSPLLRKSRTERDKSPAHAQEAKPIRRTHLAQHDVARDLEDEVRDEEDE